MERPKVNQEAMITEVSRVGENRFVGNIVIRGDDNPAIELTKDCNFYIANNVFLNLNRLRFWSRLLLKLALKRELRWIRKKTAR